MLSTIDKAGRVVIPALIREKAKLSPGTPLEITLDGFTVRIARAVPRSKLVRVGKLLVARPSVAREQLPEIDVAALLEEERGRWPW